jgi:serine/threonine protein kinase
VEAPGKIAHYEVEELVGRGSTGTVFAAYDTLKKDKVAIKLCSAGHDRLTRRQLLNEVRVARGLDHPNILRVLDAGEHDLQPYVVMQYIEGGRTLTTHCRPDNLLSHKVVAHIIVQCAQALHYAHACGVVHCDIKPNNILLTEQGIPVITDFGIAQRRADDATEIMGMVGSPQYMSPEQVTGDRITGSTDIYSLGAVMFELLTGRPVFTTTKLSEMVDKILAEKPPLLTDIVPDASKALAHIVKRTLRKRPANRYETGLALAADLSVVFSGIDPDIAQDSVDRRFRSLRNLALFRDFSDSEIRETLHVVHWESCPAGAAVTAEEGVKTFFVVVSGEVAISVGGREVRVFSAGDCFTHTGTAEPDTIYIAKGSASVLRVAARVIEEMPDQYARRFTRALLWSLADRLS